MLRRLAALLVIPLGLDLYMPVPEDNPLTPEKIELGRRLFFDRRLSRDGSVSCSSCHDPERAFSDGRAVRGRRFPAEGPPQLSGRSSIAATDACSSGTAATSTLEEQVLKPIEDPNEMDLPLDKALSRVGLAPRRFRGRSRVMSGASFRRLALRSVHQRRPRCAVFGTAEGSASVSRQRRTVPPATLARTSPTKSCTTPAWPGAL